MFVNSEFIKAMTDAYELLERLCLTNRNSTLTPDHKAILSAFRFPHLTFLSLSNFQLLDGAALIPVNSEMVVIHAVHLCLIISPFIIFLDHTRVPKTGGRSSGD